METFRSLFGKLLVFVYHCFDRIVIQGHLPLLSREGQIVYFFRDVRGEYPITQKVLQQRTNVYRAWVDAYARNHKIPVERAKKGMSKEDHVRAIPGAHGKTEPVRGLLHLPKHGAGIVLQISPTQVSDRRSALSDYPPRPEVVHPPVFLHPG